MYRRKYGFLFLHFALLIAWALPGKAQYVFQKTIDPDPAYTERPHAVAESPLGGFLLVGDMENHGSLNGDDVFVIHTDAKGTILWSYVYELANYDLDGNAIAVAPDGGAFITGSAMQNNFSSIYGFRINSNGVLQWDKLFDNTYNREAWAWNAKYEDSLGHDRFFMIGEREAVGPNLGKDPVVLKVDDNGNEIWSFVYGIPFRDERGLDLEPNSFGYYMVIEDTDPGSGARYQVLAIHPDGLPFWRRDIIWPGDARSTEIAVMPDDDIILMGSVWDAVNQDWDIGITRLNYNGTNWVNPIWAWTDQQSGDQYVRSAQLSANGDLGILIYDASANMSDLLNLDPSNGFSNWKRRYLGFSTNDGRSLCATQDGGFINLGTDILESHLWKVDANGFSGCAQEIATYNRTNQTLQNQLHFIGAGPNFNPIPTTINPAWLEPEDTDICCETAITCTPATGSGSFNKEIGSWPGDQNLYDVLPLGNGGLALAGTNQSGMSNSRDKMMAFTDAFGHVCSGSSNDQQADEWYLDLEGSGFACGTYYATGFDIQGGNIDLLLSKNDATGKPIWSYRMGGSGMEQGYEVVEYAEQVSGNTQITAIAGGFTQSYGAGGEDAFLLELDENGVFQQAAAVGFTGDERFYGLKKTGSTFGGDLIGVGQAESPGVPGTLDAWVCWMQQDGTPIASARMGMEFGDDIAHESVQDANQNTYVTGHYKIDPGRDFDMFLAKFSPTHTLLWYKLISLGQADDLAFSIDYDSQTDSLVIAGKTYSLGTAGSAAVLLQLDAQNGDVGKLRYFDGPADEGFLRVRIDAYGRPVAVGNSNSYNGSDLDAYYVRLQNWNADCAKDQAWDCRYNQMVPNTNLPGKSNVSGGQLVNTNHLSLQLKDANVCKTQGGGNGNGHNKHAERANMPSEASFSLYPNPATHSLTIDLNLDAGFERLAAVYTAQGQLVKTFSLGNSGQSTSVDISRLPPGMYVIHLHGGPEGKLTRRLSILR